MTFRMYRWMDAWMDGQMNEYISLTQIDGWMDGRIDRQIEELINGWMDAWMKRQKDGWMDQQIDECMDEYCIDRQCMDRWIDRWIERQKIYICRWVEIYIVSHLPRYHSVIPIFDRHVTIDLTLSAYFSGLFLVILQGSGSSITTQEVLAAVETADAN